MEMLYVMIPAAIFLGMIGMIFLIWSIKTGQFDDVEGPKYRIFFDDDKKAAKKSARQGKTP